MAGGESRVARFYDRWARPYDLLASHAPGVSRVRRRCVEAIGLTGGETVLDLGCGSGANVPHLRDAVGPTGRVVCLDLSAGVLRRARRRVEDHGWRNVDVCRADATRLPLAPNPGNDDSAPDAILATFVIGMFEHPGAIVDRWCDVVAPGGTVGLLYARRSDRPLAAPVNLPFRLFVRLAAPGGRLAREPPVERLERRGTLAREALEARAETVRAESLAGGYLALVVGHLHE